MTIINQKSISGITSITFASAGDDLLTFHSNNGTERFRIDNSGNTKITAGIVTTLTTTGNATVGGTLGVTGETTFTTHINFGDNAKAIFGNGSDLQIYHDTSGAGNSIIKEEGTGELRLGSNSAVRITKHDSETCALFTVDGAAELYYDNSTKFATTSTGVTITGTATADGLSLGDSEIAKFGNSDDLQIHHTGGNSFIQDKGAGILAVTSNGAGIRFMNDAQSEFLAKFEVDGAVELYYDNDLHFATTSDGCKTNGDLSFRGDGDVEQILFDASDASLKFVDNKKAKFGNGDDLEIYHNGTDSVINDSSRNLLVRASGTGDLWLQSDNQVYFGDIGGNETFIEANDNGDVKLFYDNSQKLATKSDGVVVTGAIYLDGSGGTNSANALDDYEEGTWTPAIKFGGASTGVVYSTYNRGWYTKIGRVVTLKMALEVANKGTSTGNASIVVPFNSSLTSSSHAQAIPHSKVNANMVFAYGTAGSGEFGLRHSVASTSTGFGYLNNGDFGTGFSLVGSITYMI